MAPKKPYLRPVGAYPVKHHRTCPEITRKDISYDAALKAPDTDGTAMRKASGIAFEAATIESWLAILAAEGWKTVTVDAGARAGRDLESISTLRGVGRTVLHIECSGERTKAARTRIAEATLAAMDRGVRLIIGARLVDGHRAGEPDALIRQQPDGTRSGHWLYQGLDFKEHKSFQGTRKPTEWECSPLTAPGYESVAYVEFPGIPQEVDSLQLAMYHRLLESHGRAGEPIGGIIGRELMVVWRDLRDPLYVSGTRSALQLWDETYDDFRAAQRHEHDRIEGILDASPRSAPQWGSACGECPWRDVCREELEEAGDITLLPDVTPSRAVWHRKLGVDSVNQLAALHRPTATLVDDGVDVPALLSAAQGRDPATPVSTLATGRQAAALAANGYVTAADLAELDWNTGRWHGAKVGSLGRSIDQARVHRSQRVHRARGVTHVEIPRAAVELDVDIEDDSGGICYLIGVRETIRSRGETRTRYVPFVTWENTPEAEAKVFAEFWAYMLGWQEKARTGRLGGFRAFYYTEHETRYFKHLAKSHAGKPGVPGLAEVEEFLASDAWFDMHPVIGKQLVWPVGDRTLKSLAKYVKFFWRDETPGGANSVAWYREAIECASSDPERAQELQTRLLEYNEDDVDATWHLREWVSRFGEARRPGTKLPEVSELDRRYDRTTRRRAA